MDAAEKIARIGEAPCPYGDCDQPGAGVCGTCTRQGRRAALIRRYARAVAEAVYVAVNDEGRGLDVDAIIAAIPAPEEDDDGR